MLHTNAAFRCCGEILAYRADAVAFHKQMINGGEAEAYNTVTVLMVVEAKTAQGGIDGADALAGCESLPCFVSESLLLCQHVSSGCGSQFNMDVLRRVQAGGQLIRV